MEAETRPGREISTSPSNCGCVDPCGLQLPTERDGGPRQGRPRGVATLFGHIRERKRLMLGKKKEGMSSHAADRPAVRRDDDESEQAGAAARVPRRPRPLKRIALAAAIGIVTLNVWTGGPLFALWVGSRFQGSGPPKMSSIFVVAGVLAAVSFVLVRALAILGASYDETTGQTPTVRAHTPWLRSMRGEREQYEGVRTHLTALERFLVATVIVVVALFEVWFFFFSTSPIDNRSGRSALPQAAPALAAGPSAADFGPSRTAS
jgi:hypothetical protein